MKRNVWIPKMTVGRLERLLAKPKLTSDDKEDLLDYKYFLLHQKVDALEKKLMDAIPVSQPGATCDIGNYILLPKNKFWITNINHLTDGFESKYNL